MRLVTAIVQPNMLTQVQIALAQHGVAGMTVTEVSGYARQRGHREVYRGAQYTIDFISKAKIEVLVDDVVYGSGQGRSKRLAERNAADSALLTHFQTPDEPEDG